MENYSGLLEGDHRDTEFRRKIQQFYAENGLEPTELGESFGCKFLSDCAISCPEEGLCLHTGTWPYIGSEYGEATIYGSRARILFIAMERGGRFNPSNEPTFSHTQNAFREGAETRHNPHMGGTSQLIEALIDENNRRRCSSVFALTNAVKCVWNTENQNSCSTSAMKSKCAEYLLGEIEALHPHLIITQGDHPATTLRRLYPSLTALGEFSGAAGSATVMSGENFILMTTPHPARKKGWRWKKGPLPDFLIDAASGAREAVKVLIERNS